MPALLLRLFLALYFAHLLTDFLFQTRRMVDAKKRGGVAGYLAHGGVYYLKPSPGSTHRKRRVGRGIGSGHGKTAGRGHKGLGARSHGNTPPTYEGGQMPLQRRLPKQGFRRTLKNQARRNEFAIVNLSRLGDFDEGVTIDAAALVARGLIPAGRKVKVLGDGDLKSKIKVRADAFSKSALDKIAAVGGFAELVRPSES